MSLPVAFLLITIGALLTDAGRPLIARGEFLGIVAGLTGIAALWVGLVGLFAHVIR